MLSYFPHIYLSQQNDLGSRKQCEGEHQLRFKCLCIWAVPWPLDLWMSPEQSCVMMTGVMNTPFSLWTEEDSWWLGLRAGGGLLVSCGWGPSGCRWCWSGWSRDSGLPADCVAALHRCLSSQCRTGSHCTCRWAEQMFLPIQVHSDVLRRSGNSRESDMEELEGCLSLSIIGVVCSFSSSML